MSMDVFQTIVNKCVECMSVRVTFGQFSFTFLEVFIALTVGSIVIVGIKKIFEE